MKTRKRLVIKKVNGEPGIWLVVKLVNGEEAAGEDKVFVSDKDRKLVRGENSLKE